MRQSLQSVMPKIAESMPMPRRSFKQFRTVQGAFNFMQRRAEKGLDAGLLRQSNYSKWSGNKKDDRITVNYRCGRLNIES